MTASNLSPLQKLEYDLPDERIAKFPLQERDASKLLCYSQGQIEHESFRNLAERLPSSSTLFFNNTKVIPARVFFEKATGARLEIFLLKPLLPSSIMSQVMENTETVTWECMVGNFKKWKSGSLERSLSIQNKEVTLTAQIDNREEKHIRFEWDDPSVSFAEIVEHAGKVPLPPYLNRQATEEDKPRYQTVYSEKEGAVAAPTAGLHFTDRVLSSLNEKGITQKFLTLHVSAGTFQPIKEENVINHPMHSEQMVVHREHIEAVLNAPGPIIPVGTTSMRTLESLYWFGARLIKGNELFEIEKLEPYEKGDFPTRQSAFAAILEWMNKTGRSQFIGSTEIFIFPGYTFRVCDGLITNFHQPGSTLLLLVAALIGDDWRKVYDAALGNDYRFLSYGDSSLLLPSS